MKARWSRWVIWGSDGFPGRAKKHPGGDWVRVESVPAIRREAYARALRHAGYLDQSVELALAREAEWFEDVSS